MLHHVQSDPQTVNGFFPFIYDDGVSIRDYHVMGGALGVWGPQAAETGDCLDEVKCERVDGRLVVLNCDRLHRLLNISANKLRRNHEQAIMEREGLETLMEAMLEHRKDEVVLRAICRVLASLALNPECAEALQSQGFPEFLLELFNEFFQDEFLVTDIPLILKRMKSALRSKCTAIFNEGLRKKNVCAVFAGMRLQQRDEAVQQDGLETLLRMFNHDEGCCSPILEETRLLKQILIPFVRFPTPESQLLSLTVLCVLCRSDKRFIICLGRDETIPTICNQLNHASPEAMDLDVFQKALWLFNHLARVEKNIQRLNENLLGLIMCRWRRIFASNGVVVVDLEVEEHVQEREPQEILFPLQIQRMMKEASSLGEDALFRKYPPGSDTPNSDSLDFYKQLEIIIHDKAAFISTGADNEEMNEMRLRNRQIFDARFRAH